MIVIPAGIYRFKDDVENYEDVDLQFQLPIRIVPMSYVDEDEVTHLFTVDDCNAIVCQKATMDDASIVIIAYANFNTDTYNINTLNVYDNGEPVLTSMFVAPTYIDGDLNTTPWDAAFIPEGADEPIFSSQIAPEPIYGFGQTIEVLTDTLVVDTVGGSWFLRNTERLSDVNTGPSAIIVKKTVQSMINEVNKFTNIHDVTLTDAVKSLIAKYNTLEILPRSEDYKF